MLNHDTVLYPHHLDDQQLYDFSRPLARVVAHPTQPGAWGLENQGGEKWTVTLPDLRVADVEPGRRVGLAAGIKIHFGRTTGEVRV
jgi:hypothetical protein